MISIPSLFVSLAGALVAADERLVSDVYVAGDAATFVFEVQGKRIGEHRWSYEGEVDLLGTKAHRFTGGLRLEQTLPLGKLEVRSTGEMWTDAAGLPLRLVIRTEAGGTRSVAEWTFGGGKATAKIAQGPSRRDLEVPMSAGAYVLGNNWVGMLELIAAVAPPEPGTPRTLTLFSVDAARELPFELRHQGTFTEERDGATIEGDKLRDSLGEVLKIDASGKLFALEVPLQGLEIRRTDEPFPEFEIADVPAPRADLAREEVVIQHGTGPGGVVAVRLAGTITRPQDAKGRLPAVFFVSGSGLQDREGLSGGIDLGTHEILDRVTEAGFLVLRVDDRGAGASTGPLADLSFDDLVADARACVDFLLARADVDPKRVFVIGHSEGGATAPILAAERPLAGVVLLAAPGRSLMDILAEQKRQALTDAGVPSFAIETEMAEHKKALELLTQEQEFDPSQLRADYRSEFRNRAWYRSHHRHDPIAQIAKVKCPVLIVQGGKDLQVSAERDAPALERAAKEAKNPDVTMRVLPQLDHLFKRSAGEKPSFQEYFDERPVDGEFLDLLVAWLRERAKLP